MDCPHIAQRSALADLCVYAIGHEIAAIKLCGHAAAQCTDQTGRMLLVDLALERIGELTRLELGTEGLSVSLPRLDPAELERLLALRQQAGAGRTGEGPGSRPRPHPRPSLRRLRLVRDLLSAMREFDVQAELLLRSMGTLLPPGRQHQIAEALQHSKARWIGLNREIGAYLEQLGHRASLPRQPARAAGALVGKPAT